MNETDPSLGAAATITREEYQHGFSAMHAEAMFDEQGRRTKAEKTLAVIQDYVSKTGRRVEDLHLLDIGCSTGLLTRHYGEAFGRVTGIDIDADALRYASRHNGNGSTSFLMMDSMNVGLPESSVDAVTCTHIYEHVPDSPRLMREIHRVLKPGGFCYFAAPNRLQWIEPHYQLPLLSVLPRGLADRYVRWAGKADTYYERMLWQWQLRRLVSDFEVVDYTREVIRDPARYHLTDTLKPGSAKHRLSGLLARAAYMAIPTYIWILRKQ